jgi:voltage-gated potassium channel
MKPNEKQDLSFLNLLIIILSVYVLLELLIDTFFKLPPEISKLLTNIDNAICIVFMYDFFYRFYYAENKLRFM